jgi:hypothetical protein
MNPKRGRSLRDPKLPKRFPDSCRSAKPRFFEIEYSEADVGNLKSSLEISRNLAYCSSTIYAPGIKLREVIHAYQSALILKGEVEVDGAYVNSYVRPVRRKEGRKDIRKKEFKNPDKRSFLVMRQRSGVKGGGTVKSVAAITESENDLAC